MGLRNNTTTIQGFCTLSTPQAVPAISLQFYFLLQHKVTASRAFVTGALMPDALIDLVALSFKCDTPHQNAIPLTKSLNTPSSSPELDSATAEYNSVETETNKAMIL